MLQNPCKSARFHYDTRDRFLTGRAFLQKAGKLSVRAVRCRWQGFFSTSALSDEDIFATDGLT